MKKTKIISRNDKGKTCDLKENIVKNYKNPPRALPERTGGAAAGDGGSDALRPIRRQRKVAPSKYHRNTLKK